MRERSLLRRVRLLRRVCRLREAALRRSRSPRRRERLGWRNDRLRAHRSVARKAYANILVMDGRCARAGVTHERCLAAMVVGITSV